MNHVTFNTVTKKTICYIFGWHLCPNPGIHQVWSVWTAAFDSHTCVCMRQATLLPLDVVYMVVIFPEYFLAFYFVHICTNFNLNQSENPAAYVRSIDCDLMRFEVVDFTPQRIVK